MFSKKKKWNTKFGPKKEKKDIPKRYWLYGAFSIFCIIGVVHTLRLPEYQIRNIVIKNDVLTDESDIDSIAREYLAYKYYYVVPQSNIWLYPKQKILERVESLPPVKSAKVYLDDDNNLNIELVERDNKYLWCSELGDCYYMNAVGYIFAPAPHFEGNVFLTFEGQIDSDALGKYYLDNDIMSRLLDFSARLSEIGIYISNINVKTLHDVTLTLKSGARMIIDIDADLEDVFINIKTLLSSQDFINKSHGLDAIEYIDLRYGKKAFWKPKEEVE